ncbi:MAG: lytic transglycosylase domain-containing protein [Bacteroidaceae bacterium]|nr:lytic transglycosylase domain-containing protein [Bacteroidaceae bacterium]
MTTLRLLTLISFALAVTGLSAQRNTGTPQGQYIQQAGQIPSVPDYIVFAGETIRFDRADLRERLDRELIAFTYSHTNSILMLKRANRIFPQVEPILKACGIPDDLKYLMAIESNLDPLAVSSAGAAGLWQFTQSTGKLYGLEINSNVDERYNTEKATIAACNYLKSSLSKYGDWLTVAASYNAGQGAISTRLNNQRQTKATDLVLAAETSRYMFRILVAKMMFENPQLFGFRLKSEELYPYIPAKETVSVTETISDLVQFAEDHGVSYAQLREANPWLRELTLKDSSHKEYFIDIPDVKGLHYNPRRTVAHNPRWVTE